MFVAMQSHKTFMPRVYFDGNDAVDNGRYWLGSAKSIQDMAEIPDGPKEGLQVTISMIGEIEMEAKRSNGIHGATLGRRAGSKEQFDQTPKHGR